MHEPEAGPVGPGLGGGRGSRTLLAADSFRMRATREGAAVRGFARHLERFTRAASEAWLAAGSANPDRSASEADIAARISAFVESARVRLASAGDGFPRLELWSRAAAGDHERDPGTDSGSPQLALAIRPLPPLGETIALRSAPRGARPLAHHKGPNIDAYRDLGRELDAEPLLIDASGHVLEGGTTSVIWWHPSSHHGAVSALTDRVPSVTEALLREAARLEPQTIRPEELAAREVWAVNALHGIRVVTHIDGVPCAPHDPERLDRFREMLDRHWEPVTAPRALR